MSRDTAMMQQWRELKAQHQHAILLYRCGDFYEMFNEDAITASRELGLTLTSRNNGGAADVPLAGVPVRAVNEYLRRLVEKGYRVAICEQVEDPKTAKGVVRREIVETVTPGAAFADDLLDGSRNNFLCAVTRIDGLIGIAAADLSTGELRLITAPIEDAAPALARLAPREVVIPGGIDVPVRGAALDTALITEREAWEFDPAAAAADVAERFGVHSIEGLGVGAEDRPAVAAAGALLRYLRELQPGGIRHLARPIIERTGGAMPLDEMTRRNLELVESLRGGERAGTLLDVVDRTETPMGARLLRQWILSPLVERAAIDARLDAVEALVDDGMTRTGLRDALDGVRDIERLAGKAAVGRASPREVGALGASLARLPDVEEALRRLGAHGRLATIAAGWDSCTDLAADIAGTLVDRPPTAISEEPTIRAGVDASLDEMRQLRDGGKDAIARIEADERARTGIGSLRVGYNKVFGYYLQVTNANRHLVPPDYQRRQTLADAERFVTPALKEFEERVLSAAERIEARERELFESVRERIAASIGRLQQAARAVAELDVIAAFAEVAAREGYTRPAITDGFDLAIEGGRHPVVERMMAREKFIPNDVMIDEHARILIVTGPNMAGKSTILRQTGLVVVMAQMGCFVPAARARIGIVDRLFTRVGASDNLVRGQSTFMVEMTETSAILAAASARSLVLLDEIGRGTSTYDGVSIAWAVTEHLHDQVGCKTIFATHYHELTQLADELAGVRNYTVAVREVGDTILFLHRLEPGGASRSYGIEVGRLAGLPPAVVQRARSVLALLEQESLVAPELRARTAARRRPGAADQLPLFAPEHPAIATLRGLRPETMTPIEALNALDALVRELGPRD